MAQTGNHTVTLPILIYPIEIIRSAIEEFQSRCTIKLYQVSEFEIELTITVHYESRADFRPHELNDEIVLVEDFLNYAFDLAAQRAIVESPL